MFILGDILIVAATILHYVFSFYQFVILAAVILSWVRPAPTNDIIRNILYAIHRLTDPVFAWVRMRMPAGLRNTGLDLSPMIVLLVLMGVDMLTYRVLMHTGIYLTMGVNHAPASPF